MMRRASLALLNSASETRNYAIGALIRGPDRQYALINNYRTSHLDRCAIQTGSVH